MATTAGYTGAGILNMLHGTACSVRGALQTAWDSSHHSSARCSLFKWWPLLGEGITLRILEAMRPSLRTLRLSCMRARCTAHMKPAWRQWLPNGCLVRERLPWAAVHKLAATKACMLRMTCVGDDTGREARVAGRADARKLASHDHAHATPRSACVSRLVRVRLW